MVICMRTTVTLDDDLAVLLEKKRAVEGKSFKQVLNDALRRGLFARDDDHPGAGGQPRTQSFDLGRAKVANMDNVSELLSVVEGEAYK
jgi:hypothetical protein